VILISYINKEFQRHSQYGSMCYEHGPNDMYLGMHTDLKILPPTLSISGSSPALRRIEKLLKVYPLLRKLGPQVEKYIKKNLEELAGIPSTLWLNCVWKNISGSISHRVPANHWSPVVGLNELPTRSTYVSRETSTDTIVNTMAGDWTINYGFLPAVEIVWALYQTEFQANQELDKQILYDSEESPHPGAAAVLVRHHAGALSQTLWI
jgi:hypothetical protein